MQLTIVENTHAIKWVVGIICIMQDDLRWAIRDTFVQSTHLQGYFIPR